MEREICIKCPEYLAETCDAQQETCWRMTKTVPQVIIDRLRICGEECQPTDLFVNEEETKQ